MLKQQLDRMWVALCCSSVECGATLRICSADVSAPFAKQAGCRAIAVSDCQVEGAAPLAICSTDVGAAVKQQP